MRSAPILPAAALALFFLALPALAPDAEARSVLSPRHSGMEAPGEPKKAPAMGYTDAYGYGLTDKTPEEKKPIHRPRPGAYGGPLKSGGSDPLPAPPNEKGPPLWKFQ